MSGHGLQLSNRLQNVAVASEPLRVFGLNLESRAGVTGRLGVGMVTVTAPPPCHDHTSESHSYLLLYFKLLTTSSATEPFKLNGLRYPPQAL